MSGTHHIAHVSIGRIKYPLDDPRNAEVLNSLEQLYADAEASPGFVWRMPDEDAFAGLSAAGRNPATLVSISVWTDVDSLKAYTFAGLHNRFMERADEWFEKETPPTLALWPVAVGTQPTVAEALARLEHLRQYGPSESAFGWDGPRSTQEQVTDG